MTNIQALADIVSDRLQAGGNVSLIAEPGIGQVADLIAGVTQLGLDFVMVTDFNFLDLVLPVMKSDNTLGYMALEGVMEADVFILDNVLAHSRGQDFLDKLQTGFIGEVKLKKSPIIVVRDEALVAGFEQLA